MCTRLICLAFCVYKIRYWHFFGYYKRCPRNYFLGDRGVIDPKPTSNDKMWMALRFVASFGETQPAPVFVF